MSGYLGLEGKRAPVTGGTKGVGQPAAVHDKQAFEFEKYLKAGSGRAFAKKRL
jgi:hypothetical protein